MAQYINKSAVVAEIERMVQNEYPCDNSEQGTGYSCALYELQDFLDTLEVKEVEEPSKDLEEAASQYSFNIPSAIFNDLTPVLQNIWKREIEGAFIAGAKWYKEQLKDKGE